MEVSNLTLLNGESFDESVLGIVTWRQQPIGDMPHTSLLYDFDSVLLVLHDDTWTGPKVTHTLKGERRTQVLHMNLESLERAVTSGDNSDAIMPLLSGDIVVDPGGKIAELRREIAGFSGQLRERVLLTEFARFLHGYVKAKRHLQNACVLDACSSLMTALHHWARVEVGESGAYPLPAVWEQVQGVNNSVPKLYEELTVSSETLEQRVQLVLLACEFSIMSKMADCCGLLMRVLGSRQEPWSVEELLEIPAFDHLQAELPVVLQKMVYRSLVREIPSWANRSEYGGSSVRYAI